MNVLTSLIKQLNQAPEVFSKSKDVIWTDPYISKQLLNCHLNLESEAASRKGKTIDDTIRFLMDSDFIRPGMNLLDLGCGPGLFAERLYSKGVNVTGIDFSSNSIQYAKDQAKNKGYNIIYQQSDIMNLDDYEVYDVVMQIYGELNVFSDEALNHLLNCIYNALKPGGTFIFDVTTKKHRSLHKNQTTWYTEVDGFWGQGTNLVLEQGYDYPEHGVWLDRYFVIHHEGYKEYRNWYKDYDVNTITSIVQQAGFDVEAIYGDLMGNEVQEDGEWIAMILKK